MPLGLFSFNTEYSIRPDRFARAAEDRGYESVWFPEHTHIPAGRTTPYPSGGELPREYIHMSDPFTSSAAAAAVTDVILIGTAISLVNQHDPIALAKQVATVDLISGGRFLFGVGAGWNVEEMNDHGVQFEERWPYLWEMLEAMQALWTQEEATYKGKYISFERAWSYPKPVTPGGPRVLMGAGSKWTWDRIVEYCDGWMPIGGRGSSRVSLGEKIALLKRQAEEGGRDPESLNITSFGIRPDPELIARLQEAGVDRVIFTLPSQEKEEVTPLIDECAKLIK